jgi:hypothetical protein
MCSAVQNGAAGILLRHAGSIPGHAEPTRAARRRGTPNKARAERDAEIVRLRQEGLTLAEIGRRFGIKHHTVAAALKRMGYEGGPKPVGFAAVPPEKRREIGSRGGKAAQARGTAHRFDSAEAAAAGRKGGKATQSRGTGHRFTVKEARAAGSKGGRGNKRKPSGGA